MLLRAFLLLWGCGEAGKYFLYFDIYFILDVEDLMLSLIRDWMVFFLLNIKKIWICSHDIVLEVYQLGPPTACWPFDNVMQRPSPSLVAAAGSSPLCRWNCLKTENTIPPGVRTAGQYSQMLIVQSLGRTQAARCTPCTKWTEVQVLSLPFNVPRSPAPRQPSHLPSLPAGPSPPNRVGQGILGSTACGR